MIKIVSFDTAADVMGVAWEAVVWTDPGMVVRLVSGRLYGSLSSNGTWEDIAKAKGVLAGAVAAALISRVELSLDEAAEVLEVFRASARRVGPGKWVV